MLIYQHRLGQAQGPQPHSSLAVKHNRKLHNFVIQTIAWRIDVANQEIISCCGVPRSLSKVLGTDPYREPVSSNIYLQIFGYFSKTDFRNILPLILFPKIWGAIFFHFFIWCAGGKEENNISVQYRYWMLAVILCSDSHQVLTYIFFLWGGT